MEVRFKPLYLAESMDQLEKIVKSYPTPTFIPTNFTKCYLSANLAWFEDDLELAFLLYSRVTEKLDENSTLNNEQICEVSERIAKLTKCLKSRYESFQRKNESTSNENAINEFNTVHLDNFSPKHDECLIERIFSKYGKIKTFCFNVEGERGFGFVEFELSSSAFDAASKENGKKYNGRDIKVKRYVEKMNTIPDKVSTINCTSESTQSNRGFTLKLILHNVLNDYETDDELRSLFSCFGEINKVIIFSCAEEERSGFVVIEFKYAFSTVDAYVKMRNFEMPSGQTLNISLSTADEVRKKIVEHSVFCLALLKKTPEFLM